jgi:hypothetical protein
LPKIVAALYGSAAAVLTQFLMYPSRHRLTVYRRKLDVVAQTHTLGRLVSQSREIYFQKFYITGASKIIQTQLPISTKQSS